MNRRHPWITFVIAACRWFRWLRSGKTSREQPHTHVELTRPTCGIKALPPGLSGGGTLSIKVSDAVAVSDEVMLDLA